MIMVPPNKPSVTDAERLLLLRLGARIRARREELGLSRRRLAAQAGLSERFLAQVEGGSGNVAVSRLTRIATALEVAPGSLLDSAQEGGARRDLVALVGLRGAGKSTLGGAVAERLGLRLREHDQLVAEEAGMPVEEIFTLHGESWYRELSRRVLARWLDAGTSRELLACSGGVVTDEDAWRRLRERAHTIWLKARPEDHWGRVTAQGDRRPMRGHANAQAALRRLLDRRQPLYAQAAYHLDTSALGLDAARRRLVDLVGGLLGTEGQVGSPQRGTGLPHQA